MKKRLLSILFVFTLVFTAIPSFTFATASNAQGVFFYDTFTANIGSIKDYGGSTENQAVRFHSKSGATYTYVSDNSKVVKATGIKVGYDETFFEETGRVFITGVAPGTANLILKETIKGKTKVVGKVKISVVNTTISSYHNNLKHEFGLGNQDSYLKFVNRNSNATYNFKVNKSGLTFSTQKDENGSMSIQMNATDYGTYIVTASETVNGKTRKIKDITFQVKETIIPDVITVKSEYLDLEKEMKFLDMNYEYGLNIKGQTTFRITSNGYVTFNPEDTGFSTDYDVFSSADSRVEKIGVLIANKATTVMADVYRTKRYSQGTEEVEYLKTIKVTFKF
ncbi:hypothetical protein KB559_11085 [Paenibacillus sp. Marseille-P2973]|uniref:hypothetical protein n=1 Tax=Paenibacillus sp. Marseille-P2973 TaxID=1871032 RepID=UPI001B36970E|nr:hypothetical protein [Paenibacillus sp. Marseille-P2973]MBQ4899381.1 hypothetical protein [Paenibacillus sp. Marseille-P2973]